MSDEIEAKAHSAVDRLGGNMLIGGDFVPSRSGELGNVVNPADGTAFGTVALGGAEDADAAVSAARTAFDDPSWAAMRPADRERALHRLADLVEANAEELAWLETLDNGKPLILSQRVDVPGAIEYLRYIAGWATKLEGRTLDVSFPAPRGGGQYVAYTRPEPVGVVAAIIPWNYPLMMAAWKIGPALATGCTIVLKPALETPMTALRLGELVREAGIPDGVVNIVTGDGPGLGGALTSNPGVDKIAFTGSTPVGRTIGHAAMDRMARVSLELGGKSPVILFDDANLNAAIPGAAAAIFANQGQACTAGSRLYVQRGIYDEVLEGLAGRARKMAIGPGLEKGTQLGPLVSRKQLETVTGYVEQGVGDGARIVTGGKRVDRDGYFMEPTVLADMSQSASVVQEEIFGPVLVVQPFDDAEEAIRLANDSQYGLAASIWSQDLSRVHRTIPQIRAGTVWVNCHNMLDPAMPFGGTKMSGIGREMGAAVLDLYTETKSVCMSV